jgi:hypothetical protein
MGTRTDKHSKLALRSPYLANVLKQPFFSTEVLSELVDRSEAAHQKIIEQQKAAAVNGDAPPPLPGTPLIRMEVRVSVCHTASPKPHNTISIGVETSSGVIHHLCYTPSSI